MLIPYKNILIIMLRQIGDVVLTTPIPYILKQEIPGVKITFLTESPCDQLLRNSPDIDEIIISDRKAGTLQTLKLARELRKRKFDLVLDFMANPRSAILSFLSGVTPRISFDVKGRGILYTKRVDSSGNDYAVEVKKKILKAIGIQSEWNIPRIYLTDEEKSYAQNVRSQALAGAKYMVTLDAGHKDPRRQWPDERYGELARHILDKYGVRSLLIRGPNEEETAKTVVNASAGAAVITTPTTLRQMAALVWAADGHIGNCSAPRHVAVGFETPTFTILGSSHHVWTHPGKIHTHVYKGLDCQPCKGRKVACKFDYACMGSLEFGEILEKLDEWVERVVIPASPCRNEKG